jgi:tRNA (cmo5U34)-methyltransferase
MPMSKDKVFRKKRNLVGDFNFKKEVAEVFDDMLNRSVPFYQEVQMMIGEISADFATGGTNIYDLGCSTGTTLIALDKVIPEDVNFIGIDYSQDMLDKAKEKLKKHCVSRKCEFICMDLNTSLPVNNASVVIMNLTLQFIRPLWLNEGGCLILIEKVLSIYSTLNRLFIKYYYEFKRRQGYNDMEISQKREALENILIPYRPEENRTLLLENGFKECDTFFKWYNFCGMLALK